MDPIKTTLKSKKCQTLSGKDHTTMLFQRVLSPLLKRLDRLIAIIETIMVAEHKDEDLSDNFSEPDLQSDDQGDTDMLEEDDEGSEDGEESS